MTDEQWELLEPSLNRPGKPGRKHADLRAVMDGILYIAKTGCQCGTCRRRSGRGPGRGRSSAVDPERDLGSRLAALHGQGRLRRE